VDAAQGLEKAEHAHARDGQKYDLANMELWKRRMLCSRPRVACNTSSNTHQPSKGGANGVFQSP
jgi:hypothetical protein